MNPQQAWELSLLALCCWREARNQTSAAQQAQMWSVRNRVLRPGWWGAGWAGVILAPWQYSSFNHNDPNAVLFPTPKDLAFPSILALAAEVYEGNCEDLSQGADSYYSTNIAPPSWTEEKTFTVELDAFRFYKS